MTIRRSELYERIARAYENLAAAERTIEAYPDAVVCAQTNERLIKELLKKLGDGDE